MFHQILCNPQPIANFSIDMGTMSKTLTAINSIKNANRQWTALIQKNLALPPPIFKTPKKFSGPIPRCFTKYYATQNKWQISP